MRRGLATLLTMAIGAGFAAGAHAAQPAPSYRLASYATTQRPEEVQACLLDVVAHSGMASKPTATPASLGQWEIEFQYRGVPTRIVVEQTSIRGARVTYPMTLAANAHTDRELGYSSGVEICG